MASVRRQPRHQSTRRLRGSEQLEPRLMLTGIPEFVADIAQRPMESDIVELGGDMFFITGSDAPGRRLWKTDGSVAGTQSVADIGESHNSADFTGLASIGGALYFTGPSGLWRSDGTTEGTQALGSGELVYGTAMDVGGRVVFHAGKYEDGLELWTTDGTPAGTRMLKDIYPGSTSGVSLLPEDKTALYDGKLIFVARDPQHGEELWATDGTTAGTVLLRDIVSGAGDSGIAKVSRTEFGVFFSADDQWWRTDGTPGGTVPIPGFPDFKYSFLGDWHAYGDSALFKSSRLGDMTLWSTDGTAAGTKSLGSVGYDRGISRNDIKTSHGIAYFTGVDAEHGVELWRSDGTKAGTRILADLAAGPVSSYPHSLIVVGGELYFIANDGISGEELWKVDPVSSEPVLVRDVAPGSESAVPGELVNLNGTLVFTADGPSGRSLWISDGTEAGTELLFDPQAMASDRTHYVFGSGADHVLFAAVAPNVELQMWATDGTSENTMPILEWTVRSEPSLPYVGEMDSRFKTLDDGWLFLADDGVHGDELWFSDGTPDGTRMVKDIFPGYRDAIGAFYDAFELDGVVYFAADDGQHGTELWRSDGTSEGTYLVRDINEGAASSAV